MSDASDPDSLLFSATLFLTKRLGLEARSLGVVIENKLLGEEACATRLRGCGAGALLMGVEACSAGAACGAVAGLDAIFSGFGNCTVQLLGEAP